MSGWFSTSSAPSASPSADLNNSVPVSSVSGRSFLGSASVGTGASSDSGDISGLFQHNIADRILIEERLKRESTYQSEGKSLLHDQFRPIMGGGYNNPDGTGDHHSFNPRGILKGFGAFGAGFGAGLLLNSVSLVLVKTFLVAAVLSGVYYTTQPEKSPTQQFKHEVQSFFEGMDPEPQGPVEQFLALFLRPSQVKKLKDSVYTKWAVIKDHMNANKRLTILATTGTIVGMLGM